MSNVKEKDEKVYFVQRLASYIIDVLIVMFVATLLSMPFQNNDSVTKLTKQSSEYANSYIEGKIGISEYMNKTASIDYQLAKASGVSSIITIFLNVLYFVVIQKSLGGQTIGKKLLKIKVAKKDKSDLTMNDMVLRGLINNSIWGDIIIAILLLINKNSYFYGSMIIELICFMIIIVSIFMVIIRKDGRSVSDLIAKTQVVRED